MLDKLKALLRKAINGLAVLIVMALALLYMVAAGILTTGVVNALRVDAYIDILTGVAMVLLVFMVVWAPLWFFKRLDSR